MMFLDLSGIEDGVFIVMVVILVSFLENVVIG